MAPVPPGSEVAVTGASGFIGAHVCDALLSAGYRVRAIVRNPQDAAKTAHLSALSGAAERLTFHKGELLEMGSYCEAFAGAAAVVHTAAHVELAHAGMKDPEGTIVRPSVEGVKNVLDCADRAGSVRRFLHTSSVAAVISHTADPDTEFTEADWNTSGTVANGDAYGYAKALAEREVHSHVGHGYDAISINPCVVLGPCLCKAHTKASVASLRMLLHGRPTSMAVVANTFVDVRDVAQAHVRALTLEDDSSSSPRRFLLCSDFQCKTSIYLQEILRKLFPEYQIDAVSVVSPLTLLVTFKAPLLWRLIHKEYDRASVVSRFTYDNRLSKVQLGIEYRSVEDTARDSVNSMVEPGFVKPRLKALQSKL